MPSRAGATVVDQPLEASRVAAVLHLILALFAHVFAYPLWSGLPIPSLPDRDHDAELVEAPDRAWTPPTQPRLLPPSRGRASPCSPEPSPGPSSSSHSVSEPPRNLSRPPTSASSSHRSPSPQAPRDTDLGPGSFWEWQRVLAWGGGAAFVPVDFLWFGGAWGSLAGAWMGAIPIPLDWDRPWQRWPVTCVAGRRRRVRRRHGARMGVGRRQVGDRETRGEVEEATIRRSGVWGFDAERACGREEVSCGRSGDERGRAVLRRLRYQCESVRERKTPARDGTSCPPEDQKTLRSDVEAAISRRRTGFARFGKRRKGGRSDRSRRDERDPRGDAGIRDGRSRVRARGRQPPRFPRETPPHPRRGRTARRPPRRRS